MLSTQTRLRLESICACIAGGVEVSLEDMQWATKISQANRSAAAIMRRARRRAIHGEPVAGSLDAFMEDMDLGFEDPSDHLQGPQNPVDLANWFKRGDSDSDWRQHD